MKKLVINTRYSNFSNEEQKYINEISPIGLISADEEVELCVKVRKGCVKSRNKLITANLRFVISVANQYNRDDLVLGDLIQAGNIGLCRAVDMFDHTRGFRLISYAVFYIRNEIHQAIRADSHISYPDRYYLSANKLQSLIDDQMKQEGSLITPDDVVNSLDLSAVDNHCIREYLGTPARLNAAAYSSEPVELSEYIPAREDAPAPDIEIIYSAFRKQLTDEEFQLLAWHYGIGCIAKTAPEIATEINATAPTVRFRIVRLTERLQTYARRHPQLKNLFLTEIQSI